MRRIIILVILLLFNVAFIYGINYTNKYMEENNFMIYFKGKPEVVIEDPIDVVEEEITDYDGESIDSVANKLEKYYAKTSLEGYGKYIAERAIKKSVNPYLVGAIILETTSCKNECSFVFKECNNVATMKGEPGCFGGSYKKYNSVNDGINDLVQMINTKYGEKEKQNPNTIYKELGKNVSWAFKVSRHIEEIKKIK